MPQSRILTLATVVALLPAVAGAQSEKDLRKAAEGITPETVYERISVIAHDSMGGRNTPSPGLEKTAAYLVSIYQKAGLKPAGENGTWYQRYPMVKVRANPATAYLELNENGTISRYYLTESGFAAPGSVGAEVVGPGVLLAGAMTPADVEGVELAGRIVFLVEDVARALEWRRVEQAVARKNPAGVVIIRNDAPENFARFREAAESPRYRLERANAQPGPTVLTFHDQRFANDPMQAQRPDFAMLRASATPVVMPFPETVGVSVFAEDEMVERVMVPNVVAMVEGSDARLRNEYVIYSSHMDHVGTVGDGVGGCSHRGDDDRTDMICNGADDDASGTIGTVMVGEAFAKLGRKPRRSILLLHVSGEEKGLLGSEWFSDHPTVPLDRIVANVNLDMIGRNNPDSIVVIGKEHSDLGATLARVNAAHPEVGLTTADDLWPEQRFYERSDHFNFARYGVPVLFFFNGVHEQYHRVADHVDLIDTDKLARVARIAFYLGAEVANAPGRPTWDPASYEKFVVKK